MTAFPSAGILDNPTVTEAAFQSAIGAFLAATKELLGAKAIEEIQISSNTIAPTGAIVIVDTEGLASTDLLEAIVPTNTQRIVLLRISSGTRTVTLKHNSSGTGKLMLRDSMDVTLTTNKQWIMFAYNDTLSQWEEVSRNFSELNPSATNALKFPRMNSGGTAHEYRSASQMLDDLGGGSIGKQLFALSAAVGLSLLDNAVKVFDFDLSAGFTSSWTAKNLVVGTVREWILTRDVTFEGEVGYIEDAPVGAALIWDVGKVTGTDTFNSLYSTKPRFADGANTLTPGTLSTTTGSAGDRMREIIVQVGSTTPGARMRAAMKARLR